MKEQILKLCTDREKYVFQDAGPASFTAKVFRGSNKGLIIKCQKIFLWNRFSLECRSPNLASFFYACEVTDIESPPCAPVHRLMPAYFSDRLSVHTF